MTKIDANGGIETIEHFEIICKRCGSNNTKISIKGAPGFGDVGMIDASCQNCNDYEYAKLRI